MSFFKRKSEHHHTKEELAHPGESRTHTSPPFNAKESPQARPRQSVIPPQAPRSLQDRNEHRNTMQPQPLADRNGRGTPPTGQRPLQQSNLPKPQVQNAPSYPWSTRQLTLSPGEHGNPQTALISPFPRYGLSLPPVPTQSGHLLIFGGLVREAVRNDLFALDCHDFSASPIQSFGEIPVPRVGHASALVRSVLLLWGGDTKTRMEDEQDEAIYLFNIHTREWTRILAGGDRPQGRYGHAVCMIGNTFYVFGGQADGLFMNDLWGFDLSTLMAGPTWHPVEPVGVRPPARTGHVMVTGQNKLYIFGGTDGAFHYNDTWCYDLQTRTWVELQCIGYIPVPREGHAAALVDDTMYIFGGRDVNGKDLGDLAAFKISNRRWYMFQNMGPAPSGRSGHAMAAFGKHVFVLGGESNAAFVQPRADDPNVVHVLDTSKIKYPPETQRSTQAEGSSQPEQSRLDRKTSNPVLKDGPPAPAEGYDLRTADNDRKAAITGNAADADLNGRETDAALHKEHQLDQHDRAALAPSLPLQAVPQPAVNVDASRGVAPPQRPRREGDEAYSQRAGNRTSPNSAPLDASATSRHQRAISPVPVDDVNAKTGSSIMSARSPPADAFYYGTRSPTSAGFPNLDDSGAAGGGDAAGSGPGLGERLAEAERRNAVLRSALEQALERGSPTTSLALLRESPDGYGESPAQILQAALAVQARLSAMKLEFSERIEELADEYAAAERLRDGAIQEAAYLRAKLAILESDNPNDLEGLEAERMMDMEDTLIGLEDEKRELVERMSELSATVDTLTKQISSAQTDLADATSRAERASEAETLLRAELKDAQAVGFQADSEARELKSRHLEATASLASKEAELTEHMQRGKELSSERESHLKLIEGTKSALALANRKAEAVSIQHTQALETLRATEADLRNARAAHEERSSEAKVNAAKVESLEETIRHLEEENQALRTMADSNLVRAVESSQTRHEGGESNHNERLAAMMQDSASLRKMLNEAGTQIDGAQNSLLAQRREADTLRSEGQRLREEVAYLKQILKDREDAASRAKENQLRKGHEDRRVQDDHMALTARCAMLRGLLADHGVAVEDGEGSALPATPSDTQQLRVQMEEQARRLEDTQEELSRTRAQLLELKLHPEASPSDSGANAATGVRSASTGDAGEESAEYLSLKARHKQLTIDYETACRYVKQSERAFRRIKDDVTRQKQVNDSLRGELAASQGVGTDAGARTRTATSGRVTPIGDTEAMARQHQRVLAERNELQSQLEALKEELDAARSIAVARERETEISRRRAADAEQRLSSIKQELGATGVMSVAELAAANESLRAQVSELQLRVNLLLDEDSGSNIRHSELDFEGFHGLGARSDSDDDGVKPLSNGRRNHAS